MVQIEANPDRQGRSRHSQEANAGKFYESEDARWKPRGLFDKAAAYE